MHALSRMLFWIVGLVFAAPAGAVMLAVGILAEPAARDLIAALGLAALGVLMSAAFGGGVPEALALSLLVAFWTLAIVLVVAPVALVSAIGEITGQRAAAFYGGVTGLVTASLPWLLRGGIPEAGVQAAEGRLTAVLFVTGAVAGLTYWLVSGRSAGAPPTADVSPDAP